MGSYVWQAERVRRHSGNAQPQRVSPSPLLRAQAVRAVVGLAAAAASMRRAALRPASQPWHPWVVTQASQLFSPRPVPAHQVELAAAAPMMRMLPLALLPW